MAEVAFVPGFMQRAETWAPVANVVGERYPSVCVELGAESPPGAAVVGYSMGGRRALHAAFQAAPPVLVLVGVSAGIEDDTERDARRRSDEELASWIEHQPIETVVERWERNPALAGQPPEVVEGQRAGRLSHEPAELAATLRHYGQGAMPPVWHRLGELATPLLAIAGDRDDRYAEAAQRIASLAPRAQAAVVPDAGHAAHLERPQAVAELVLDFLDEHFAEGGRTDVDS